MVKKNKTKIGRNDPCPCGSGKKHKKCCIDKFDSQFQIPSSLGLDKLKKELEDFDQLDLIATLGGLQIYKKNHSCALRLEVASRIASSIKNRGKKKLEPNHFEKIINKHLPAEGAIGLMEDPPENLFTENIVFHGGNYVVYPGIEESECFILRNLFQTIFHKRNDFPDEFKKIVKSVSISLLTLSNWVASRLGHSRYLDSPDIFHEKIEVPNKHNIRMLSNAVTFTKQEIDNLLKECRLDYDFFRQFIIQAGDPSLLEEDPEKNPLFIRPLVDVYNNLVLVLPGSIISALRHFILVISKKYGTCGLLANKYREILWENVQECLRLMLFENIDIKLPPREENLPIEEGIYKFDTDKLAYIQLMADDASNYSEDQPHGMWELNNLPGKVDLRNDAIAQWLTKGKNPYCQELFIISILGRIGRYILFGLKKQPKNARVLLLSAEDLEAFIRLRDCDNLTLWKYTKAHEKLIKFSKLSMITSSFLDVFALYLKSNHSFYISDEAKPTVITLTPGFGRSIRIKAAQTGDVHATLHGDPPHYLTVLRRYNDKSIPIYLPERGIGRSLEQVVEGYGQPIWIDSGDKLEKISNKLRKVYFEITEMFAYWIWQLTPSLRSHLESLGPNPIHILFRLENPENWSNLNKDKKESIPEFEKKIDNRKIKLTIPTNIRTHLMRPDNKGERLILDALMQSFDDILKNSGNSHNLDKEERARILETHAPLGQKKKFFIISTETSVSLDSRYLSHLRLLQEHDLEEQLDGLVEELGKEAPEIGEIIEKEKKTELCNDIVNIYLKRLKSTLSKFPWYSLLEQLIAYNEAVWNRRAFNRLTIPTTIECFTDIQSYVKKLASESQKIDSTSLSIRTLIEIVSAEPPKGDQEVSMDELDKLLAVTHHLINWAMISDHIHLGLLNHKLSILNSGRVGVKKESIEGIWDPFIRIKTLEQVESAKKNFENQIRYESEIEKNDMGLKELDAVFKAELGFTVTQIIEFHKSLTLLGFEQKKVSPHLPLYQLNNRLKKILNFSNTEISDIIKLFSLVPREKWEKAPNGFNASADIWPWRYRRRLSFIRRPIIIGPEPEGDSIVFWGSRHTEEACKQLLALVLTGRYKLYEDSSEEMKKFIGKIKNDVGKKFTNEVKKWFEENTNLFVDSEVPIKPREKLNSENDLGDVDVLVIDNVNKKIFSIECKNLNYGRNPREIANEVERLMGKVETSVSWIDKHIKRDKWLKENIINLISVYNLQSKDYKICSFILTSEEIPATYITKIPLPCISFSRLIHQEGKILNVI